MKRFFSFLDILAIGILVWAIAAISFIPIGVVLEAGTKEGLSNGSDIEKISHFFFTMWNVIPKIFVITIWLIAVWKVAVLFISSDFYTKNIKGRDLVYQGKVKAWNWNI